MRFVSGLKFQEPGNDFRDCFLVVRALGNIFCQVAPDIFRIYFIADQDNDYFVQISGGFNMHRPNVMLVHNPERFYLRVRKKFLADRDSFAAQRYRDFLGPAPGIKENRSRYENPEQRAEIIAGIEIIGDNHCRDNRESKIPSQSFFVMFEFKRLPLQDSVFVVFVWHVCVGGRGGPGTSASAFIINLFRLFSNMCASLADKPRTISF